jgi:uncharacterized membrane protein YhaH (DUF805 family)
MNEYISVLKQYAVFSGRARRREYWMFFLFNIIIAVVLNVVGALIHLPIIGTLYSLAVLVPGIAVSIRRVHDVTKSGWYLLIPIYNLILVCTPGVTGPNEYGADPKEAALVPA